MAFSMSGLTIAGGMKGQTPQFWVYKTNDLRSVVDSAGYFDNGATTNTGVRSLFQKGDLIYILSDADSSFQYGLAVVNEITAAGVVDISSLTIIGTIDSD